MKQHTSEQMQPYIRPRGADLPGSAGPDAICASSPDHDRGLRGPVPAQGWRKSVWPIVSSIRSPLASCGKASHFSCSRTYPVICLTSLVSV